MAVEVVYAGLNACTKSTFGFTWAVIIGATPTDTSSARKWRAGLSAAREFWAVVSCLTLSRWACRPVRSIAASGCCRDAHDARAALCFSEILRTVFTDIAFAAHAMVAEDALSVDVALCSTIDRCQPLIRASACARGMATLNNSLGNAYNPR